MTQDVYFPLSEYADAEGWLLAGLVPDALDSLWVTQIEYDDEDDTFRVGVLIEQELVLQVPGLDFLEVAVAPGSGGTELRLALTLSPFGVRLEDAPIVLRVDAEILQPMKPGSDEPDTSKDKLDITLGKVNLGLDGEGEVDLSFSGVVSVPRCMVGTSGVVLDIGKLRWISPGGANLPSGTPAGFIGVYLDDVKAEIVGLPSSAGAIGMDDVFIGTGGFSGQIAWSDTSLAWDPGRSTFTGAVTGELFGFQGGLSTIRVAFQQGALTQCAIAGDVFVPYLDKRVGLTLGLDGNGGVTAIAGLPTSTPAEKGISAGKTGYLLHLEAGGFLKLDLDAIRFAAPAGRAAVLELSGRAELHVAGLDMPKFGLKGFRIDTNGNVAIDGGWIPLPEAKKASVRGFPLEITKVGFGAEESGRRWLGLNGGLKLAEGLPLGTSVEGLRISWDPTRPTPELVLASVEVTLEGVGLEVKVPGVFEFAGTVALFTEKATGNSGFRGQVVLKLTAVGLTVGASLVVGRTPQGDTYFFLFLAADLPTGIPLFSTGAAFYGFAGLLATNMAPDRRDEPWYAWYRREPKGVAAEKWRVEPGASAVGLGVTLGTAMDDGFAFYTNALLILVLPGPQLLLQGRGSFLKERRPPSEKADREGAFEALIVLDVPAKLFQANLAAAYQVELLLDIRGSADIAFSWAHTPPPDVWHVYVGEKEPIERRLQAQVLKILRANAYFQLRDSGIALGSWIGMNERFSWGPVSAWLQASIEGDADVSWRPGSFNGFLRLYGDAGLSVFGVTLQIILDARVKAKAPTPWFVEILVRLMIKIDLLLFKWTFDRELPLTWGDEISPLPKPAMPVLQRVALESPKATEDVDPLGGATVPPDGRPVIVFSRPVRDLAEIGTPGVSNKPDPDVVGPRAFSYQLHHLILVSTSGAQRVIGAAGVLDVSNGAINLPPQVSLPGVGGGTLELLDSRLSFPVSGSGAGTLSVTGTLPEGRHPYRLNGRRARASVQVASVAVAPFGTATATLTADTGEAKNAFTCGTLSQAGQTWNVVENDGASVTVVSAPSALPKAGAATLLAPPGAALSGQWLPVDDKDSPEANGPTTKLMVWARTPFAWFRRADQSATDGFDRHNPDYACGPEAAEEPICVSFGDLPIGPLRGSFQTELLRGASTGEAHVAAMPAGTGRFLRIGQRADGRSANGEVTLHFEPPIEWLRVRCSTREGGRISAYRRGVQVSQQVVPDRGRVELTTEMDEIRISGSLVDVSEVCFLPGWTCLTFDAQSFPQGSTDRQSYAGVWLSSFCTMNVADNELVVEPPCKPIAGALIPGFAGPIDTRLWLNFLTVELPQPVTRVRIDLTKGPVRVTAYAGTREVTQGSGGAGDELSFLAGADWIDRVVVTAIGGSASAPISPIGVRRICYDAGEFGWRRFEQWGWRRSVQRSIESLYQVEPVLEPGEYRLDAITAVQTTGAAPKLDVSVESSAFTVGPPPGLGVPTGNAEVDRRYPHGGPLNTLGTYVGETLPAPGERAFYRGYDVEVEFTAAYVSRMFLAARTPLTLAVVDSNDVERRPGTRTVWGPQSEFKLAREEEAWIKTLHGDGSKRCATVDVGRVVRNEAVSAGAGELLGPAELHAAELRTGTKPLHRFEFVTSRFARFGHLMATFDGRCRRVIGTKAGPDLPKLSKPVLDAQKALGVILDDHARTRGPATTGSPTRAQIDAFRAAREAVPWARAALANARARAFDEAWSAYFDVPPEATLPDGIEVSRIAPKAGSTAPAALLIESPEPMHWERLSVEGIGMSARRPLRRRTILFEKRAFGAPDKGTFAYAGLGWDTDVELLVVNGAVEPRVPGQSTLALTIPAAAAVSVAVRVDSGGTVTLQGRGRRVSGVVRQGPTVGVPASMTLTGAEITKLSLMGNGFSVVSLSIDEVFQPAPPRSDVRLVHAKLPVSSTDLRHRVEVIPYRDVELGNWSIRWLGAFAPEKSGTYYTFAPGTTLADGRVARVYGGLANPPADLGVDIYAGGGVGAQPPSGGSIFQLVDPAGRVVHELAALLDSTYASPAVPADEIVVIPNGDGTRALLFSTTGPLEAKHMRVVLRFDRDAGPELPKLAVGGNREPERSILAFTA